MEQDKPGPDPWDLSDSSAFSHCFKLCALALVFLFDLNLQGLDFLPDVLTYAIVFFALDGIRGRHRLVAATRALAVPLGLASLLDFFPYGLENVVIGAAVTVVHLVFVWLLFQIVVDTLNRFQRAAAARTAGMARLAYVLFFGAFLVVGAAATAIGAGLSSEGAGAVALVLVVVGFGVVAGLCYAMWLASQELGGGRRPRTVAYPAMQGRPPS